MARAAGTFVVHTLEEETVVGTGYAGVRPLDYAEGGRTSLERFFKSVPLLSLGRPHPTVFVLRVTDSLPHALSVRTTIKTSPPLFLWIEEGPLANATTSRTPTPTKIGLGRAWIPLGSRLEPGKRNGAVRYPPPRVPKIS